MVNWPIASFRRMKGRESAPAEQMGGSGFWSSPLAEEMEGDNVTIAVTYLEKHQVAKKSIRTRPVERASWRHGS